MPLGILVVDDDSYVRLGLKLVLQHVPGFQVVGEAANATEAVEKAAALQPDVIVMDIRMPGKNGIEATREILASRPESKVIMLTSYAQDELLFDAIAAGASGYVLKDMQPEQLVQAIKTVAEGKSMIDPALTQKVFAKVREATRRAESDIFADLNEQEMKILALVAEGKTNREIAEKVFLSEKTVRNYVSSILSKLHLSTRAQAAAFAVQHRIQDHLSPH
jgi:two-component system response regulator DevR